jgi:hypothetical protein
MAVLATGRHMVPRQAPWTIRRSGRGRGMTCRVTVPIGPGCCKVPAARTMDRGPGARSRADLAGRVSPMRFRQGFQPARRAKRAIDRGQMNLHRADRQIQAPGDGFRGATLREQLEDVALTLR